MMLLTLTCRCRVLEEDITRLDVQMVAMLLLVRDEDTARSMSDAFRFA